MGLLIERIRYALQILTGKALPTAYLAKRKIVNNDYHLIQISAKYNLYYGDVQEITINNMISSLMKILYENRLIQVNQTLGNTINEKVINMSIKVVK